MEASYPSTDEWMKDMWYIYNGLLSRKKKLILPFETTWLDLNGIMLSEILISQRKATYDLIYM